MSWEPQTEHRSQILKWKTNTLLVLSSEILAVICWQQQTQDGEICEWYVINCLFNQVPTKSWNGVNGHTEVYLQYKDNKSQVCVTLCMLQG